MHSPNPGDLALCSGNAAVPAGPAITRLDLSGMPAVRGVSLAGASFWVGGGRARVERDSVLHANRCALERHTHRVRRGLTKRYYSNAAPVP